MFYYNSSAKHYQDIKERLLEKARERRKRKKTPYYNYEKLFSFRKISQSQASITNSFWQKLGQVYLFRAYVWKVCQVNKISSHPALREFF